jgi:PST family polysaccharide transporter
MVKAHRAVALVSWPISALTLASAYPLIETVYGHRWIAAAPVLAVLAPYGVLFIHSLLFANVLIGGSGHARVLLYIQLIWLAVLIPAMAVGIHFRGTVGAAEAHVVVIVCVVMPCYLLASRRLSGVHVTGILTALGPTAVAAIVAAAVDYAVSLPIHTPWLKLLTGLTAGSLVYLVASAHAMKSLLPSMESGRLARVGGLAGRIVEAADRPRMMLRGFRIASHEGPQQP